MPVAPDSGLPLVSIVIPAHNRGALLAETLASCLLQTHPKLEILVIDDGSEEDLPAVLDQVGTLLDGRDKMKYFRHDPPAGANVSRNRGLREAKGDFIQYLDSDDVLHPEKIARQLDRLLQQPDLDMVLCLDEFFERTPGDLGLIWNVPDETPVLDRFLKEDTLWGTSTPLWRREALARLPAWDEDLICWQDWVFHVRVLCRRVRYETLQNVLEYIREHGETRISNAATLHEREAAKLRAGRRVAQEVKQAGMWTRLRGDLLAIFMLNKAAGLGGSGLRRLMGKFLVEAWRQAGTLRLRVAATILLGSLLTRGLFARRFNIQPLYDRLAMRMRLPRQEWKWKTAPVPERDIPEELLRALARVRGTIREVP